jgi:hypothetical protein
MLIEFSIDGDIENLDEARDPNRDWFRPDITLRGRVGPAAGDGCA